MNLAAFKHITEAHPLSMVGGTNLTTILVAIETIRDIPVRPYTYAHEFGEHWLNNGQPLAERLVEEAAKQLPVNKAMCVEYIRRLYQQRCRRFLDPGYVFYNEIKLHDLFKLFEVDGLEEGNVWRALHFVGEYLPANVQRFASVAFSGLAGSDRLLEEMTLEITDDMEAKLDVPAWAVAKMQKVVRVILYRIMAFLSINANGVFYGDKRSGDFVEAALIAMGLPEQDCQRALREIIGDETPWLSVSNYYETSLKGDEDADND